MENQSGPTACDWALATMVEMRDTASFSPSGLGAALLMSVVLAVRYRQSRQPKYRFARLM